MVDLLRHTPAASCRAVEDPPMMGAGIQQDNSDDTTSTTTTTSRRSASGESRGTPTKCWVGRRRRRPRACSKNTTTSSPTSSIGGASSPSLPDCPMSNRSSSSSSSSSEKCDNNNNNEKDNVKESRVLKKTVSSCLVGPEVLLGPPLYPLDTPVQKYFYNASAGVAQLYAGTVESYDAAERLYFIRYQDGDGEEMNEGEVTHVLVTAATRCVPRVSSEWLTVDNNNNNNKNNNTCLFALHGIVAPSPTSPTSKKRQRGGRSSNKATATAQRQQQQQRQQLFFLYVSERQRMWVRRRRGDPAPWSASPILQQYSWCNNYRQVDRGTTFFHAHVVELWHTQYRSSSSQRSDGFVRRVLFDAYLYRQINRIETFLQAGGFPLEGQTQSFFKTLEKMQRNGESIFTGAHQTTHLRELKERIRYATTRINNKTTQQCPLDKVCDAILRANNHDKETIVKELQTLPGVGTFTAWQILCDMQESQCVPIDADDDYCALGPGAKHGLQLIFPNQAPSLELAQSLVKCHRKVYRDLGIEFPYWQDRPLTIKEIEHALCEYAKFCSLNRRVNRGGGRAFRSRSHLDPEQTCCFQCKSTVCADDDGCGGGGGSLLCDTCGLRYCTNCIKNDAASPPQPCSWICRRCATLGL